MYFEYLAEKNKEALQKAIKANNVILLAGADQLGFGISRYIIRNYIPRDKIYFVYLEPFKFDGMKRKDKAMQMLGFAEEHINEVYTVDPNEIMKEYKWNDLKHVSNDVDLKINNIISKIIAR